MNMPNKNLEEIITDWIRKIYASRDIGYIGYISKKEVKELVKMIAYEDRNYDG